MLKTIGLHILLSHQVPAWVLVIVCLFFVALESVRLIFARSACDAHEQWLESAQGDKAALQAALETQNTAVQALASALAAISGEHEHAE